MNFVSTSRSLSLCHAYAFLFWCLWSRLLLVKKLIILRSQNLSHWLCFWRFHLWLISFICCKDHLAKWEENVLAFKCPLAWIILNSFVLLCKGKYLWGLWFCSEIIREVNFIPSWMAVDLKSWPDSIYVLLKHVPLPKPIRCRLGSVAFSHLKGSIVSFQFWFLER